MSQQALDRQHDEVKDRARRKRLADMKQAGQLAAEANRRHGK